MRSLQQRIQMVALWLTIMMASLLILYFGTQTYGAYTYYDLKLANQRHANHQDQFEQVDVQTILTSPDYLGKTVKIHGELLTPEPIKTKFFNEPSSCFKSITYLRYLDVEWVSGGRNQSGSTGRVRREVERWKLHDQAEGFAPIWLKDNTGQVRLNLTPAEHYTHLNRHTLERKDGNKSYEDTYCPVSGEISVVAQVAKTGPDIIVLANAPNQPLQVDWPKPGERETLTQAVASAQKDYQNYRDKLIAAALLWLITLSILIWRFISSRKN